VSWSLPQRRSRFSKERSLRKTDDNSAAAVSGINIGHSEGRLPPIPVVAPQLEVVALPRHAGDDVTDTGPRIEPLVQQLQLRRAPFEREEPHRAARRRSRRPPVFGSIVGVEISGVWAALVEAAAAGEAAGPALAQEERARSCDGASLRGLTRSSISHGLRYADWDSRRSIHR
jgi:hypothetical protein